MNKKLLILSLVGFAALSQAKRMVKSATSSVDATTSLSDPDHYHEVVGNDYITFGYSYGYDAGW